MRAASSARRLLGVRGATASTLGCDRLASNLPRETHRLAPKALALSERAHPRSCAAAGRRCFTLSSRLGVPARDTSRLSAPMRRSTSCSASAELPVDMGHLTAVGDGVTCEREAPGDEGPTPLALKGGLPGTTSSFDAKYCSFGELAQVPQFAELLVAGAESFSAGRLAGDRGTVIALRTGSACNRAALAATPCAMDSHRPIPVAPMAPETEHSVDEQPEPGAETTKEEVKARSDPEPPESASVPDAADATEADME
mmetsp:Transcript_8111/g.20251  ORF Transcript_8111/g.20251 Transcript_8111/m.20251 type:complete len:256 (-) Transcript_8111:50-817(-)